MPGIGHDPENIFDAAKLRIIWEIRIHIYPACNTNMGHKQIQCNLLNSIQAHKMYGIKVAGTFVQKALIYTNAELQASLFNTFCITIILHITYTYVSFNLVRRNPAVVPFMTEIIYGEADYPVCLQSFSK